MGSGGMAGMGGASGAASGAAASGGMGGMGGMDVTGLMSMMGGGGNKKKFSFEEYLMKLLSAQASGMPASMGGTGGSVPDYSALRGWLAQSRIPPSVSDSSAAGLSGEGALFGANL